MKKNIILLAAGLLFLVSTAVQAQFVTKSGQKSNNPKTPVTGTLESDIEAFHLQKEKLKSAFLAQNQPGVDAARQALLNLAQEEIQRTSGTLRALKSGKLTKNPNTGKEFNRKIEVQVLTNRLNREKYLLKNMQTFNPDNVTEPRGFSSILSNLDEFERLMKANLKYEKKQAPAGNTTGNNGTSTIKHEYTGGGTMISSHNNTPQKPKSGHKKHSDDFYKQNEQRQIDALNRMTGKRKQHAKTLLSDFNTALKKGNHQKSSIIISEATSLVHSDMRANKKFLKRAKSFRVISINKEALDNLVKKEAAMEKELKSIKTKNMQDIKAGSEKFKRIMNHFINLENGLQ